MALQMNYYHPQIGITFYNAYWRINPINGLSGGKDEMNYILEVFKDVDMAHVENPYPLNKLSFSFIPDISEGANNFIAQAYNHAKTLSIFNGSVDV